MAARKAQVELPIVEVAVPFMVTATVILLLWMAKQPQS